MKNIIFIIIAVFLIILSCFIFTEYVGAYSNTLSLMDIVVDAPKRVEGNIPFFVIIRDSAVEKGVGIKSIQINDMHNNNNEIYRFEGKYITGIVYDKDNSYMYWVFFTYLERNKFTIKYENGNNLITIQVKLELFSQYFGGGQRDLRIETRELQFIVADPLPKIDNWYYGDTHTHSMFTNNFAEFGAPVFAMVEAAYSSGLSWFIITDHSCDYDDVYSWKPSFLVRDLGPLPSIWTLIFHSYDPAYPIQKILFYPADNTWDTALGEVENNIHPCVTVLLGQEVNIVDVEHSREGDPPGDGDQYMLHLLVYDNEYIEAGSSGRPSWLSIPIFGSLISGNDHAGQTQYMVNILSKIKNNGFAYAAHPQNILSPWVSGDDNWHDKEYELAFFKDEGGHKVVGLQIFNTKQVRQTTDVSKPYSSTWREYKEDDAHPYSIYRGVYIWDNLNRKTLNSSDYVKIFAIGGSDAHGDFNYMSHFGGKNFVTDNYFGKVRTAIFARDAGEKPQKKQIYNALKNGHAVMTDGPLIVFGIDENDNNNINDNEDIIIGESVSVRRDTDKEFYIQWESTYEFGNIKNLCLIRGTHNEKTQWYEFPNNLSGVIKVPLRPLLPLEEDYCYFRIEVLTDKGYTAYTNPIWVEFANWTVMVYMAAEDDLDEAAFKDINEMEKIGSSDNVSIMVQVDFKSPTSLPGLWESENTTYRYHIKKDDDMNSISSSVIKSWNDLNMGKPQTLEDFVSWATEKFSANHYALIIWDRGFGWKGICKDTTNGEDLLYMGELDEALAPFQPLDVIGFDAGLMGMIEVGYQIFPYANIMVASEERILLDGWPYDTILEGLKENPNWTGLQLVRRIVDDYHKYYTSKEPDPLHTISAVNLSDNFRDLVFMVDKFADEMLGKHSQDEWGLEDYDFRFEKHYDPNDNVQIDVKNALSATECYKDRNFKDLYDFMKNINEADSIPPEYKTQAIPIMNKLKENAGVIIQEEHGNAHGNSHGLSIYFPSSQTKYSGVENPFDDPWPSCITDDSTSLATYAEDFSTEWGKVPYLPPGPPHPLPETPKFYFRDNTLWDEFLHRYYKPVADAGEDQVIWVPWGHLGAWVTLCGCGSSDADGSLTKYIWDINVNIDSDDDDWDRDGVDETNDDKDAEGHVVSVWLPVGTHEIKLTVWDDHTSEPQTPTDYNKTSWIGHANHWKTDQDPVIIKIIPKISLEPYIPIPWSFWKPWKNKGVIGTIKYSGADSIIIKPEYTSIFEPIPLSELTWHETQDLMWNPLEEIIIYPDDEIRIYLPMELGTISALTRYTISWLNNPEDIITRFISEVTLVDTFQESCISISKTLTNFDIRNIHSMPLDCFELVFHGSNISTSNVLGWYDPPENPYTVGDTWYGGWGCPPWITGIYDGIDIEWNDIYTPIIPNKWVHVGLEIDPLIPLPNEISGHWTILTTAPEKPNIPMGSTTIKKDIEYTYTTRTIDEEEDQIYYQFDWGDGTCSDWLGPYNSNVNVSTSHTWYEKGTYEIKVLAKDEHGLESDWSDPLRISVTENKVTHKFSISRSIGINSRLNSILNQLLKL